jgi:hypothetical protein
VNLSLLRTNSLKFQPLIIYSSLAWQIRIVFFMNIKLFCKKYSPSYNCNLPWLLLDGSTVLIWWMLKCWMTTRVNTNPSKLTTTACSGNHISFLYNLVWETLLFCNKKMLISSLDFNVTCHLGVILLTFVKNSSAFFLWK